MNTLLVSFLEVRRACFSHTPILNCYESKIVHKILTTTLFIVYLFIVVFLSLYAGHPALKCPSAHSQYHIAVVPLDNAFGLL